MDWLSGVPLPHSEAWNGHRTSWYLSVPTEVIHHYISSFQRGKWDESPGQFPVEELEEVCRIKSIEDQKSVWSVFSNPRRIQYGGDILGALMSMESQYPMPVVPHSKCVSPGKIPISFRFPWNIHPGPVGCMNVEIPEDMKRYEVNTDWTEFQSWCGPWAGTNSRESRMPVFAHIIDQLGIGSAENPVDGIHFESVQKMENIPWNHLAELSRDFSNEHQIQIVTDWGTIMRMASASSEGPNNIMWTGMPLAYRRRRLEKAFLQFLIKRLVYERLQDS